MTRPARIVMTLLIALGAGPAAADDQCRVVDIDFTPASFVSTEAMVSSSQMVVWLEQADGTFVDTLFITAKTGTYGLGNRPGRFDFNSGPDWPYGRRITTFPVWSHKHGQLYPEVEFRNGAEDNLSHGTSECSQEVFYCRPMQRDLEPSHWDSQTCASTNVYTDKGKFGAGTTGYPPRQDLVRAPSDSGDVSAFGSFNDLDAVSRATPAEDMPASLSWLIPSDLPAGHYVVWAEVSREFDHNTTYSIAAYPAPTGISYGDYGEPYRGQPSVLYQVPFAIEAAGDTTQSTLTYAGYGDPDGLDGNVRAPDSTITVGVAGSGAERLAVRADGGEPYRLRVTAHTKPDVANPGAVSGLALEDVTSSTARVQFVAPGDDGDVGRASQYEVRFQIAEPITDANFEQASLLATAVVPDEPGTIQSIPLDHLLWNTDYYVAIRAVDDCRKVGPLATFAFRTADRPQGEVDACFIATAAYGSVMAPDVALLRGFRDRVLRDSALGQLVVGSYYTFGPAIAGAIGESDPLREVVRALLAPIVSRVRALAR